MQEEYSEEEVALVEEETVAGVIREDSRIRVSLGVTEQEHSQGGKISVLADTGVRRTILNLGGSGKAPRDEDYLISCIFLQYRKL